MTSSVECAKRIVMNGIKKVVYLDEYSKSEQNKASCLIFEKGGVEVVKFQGREQIAKIGSKLVRKLKR